MTKVELSMSDRGRKVPVRLGDRIVLTLPENPTTGVRWQEQKLESYALEIVDDKNVAGGPGVGAEGARKLTLRPTRPGLIALQLLRHQGWESEETADETFDVKLDVR